MVELFFFELTGIIILFLLFGRLVEQLQKPQPIAELDLLFCKMDQMSVWTMRMKSERWNYLKRLYLVQKIKKKWFVFSQLKSTITEIYLRIGKTFLAKFSWQNAYMNGLLHHLVLHIIAYLYCMESFCCNQLKNTSQFWRSTFHY